MNKIKVAHILHSVGGVDVYLRLTLEQLNTDKFNPIVIHGDEDTKTPFLDKKMHKVVDFTIPLQREISVTKDLVSVVKTIKILRKEKPNVIHAHSAKGGIIARAASLFYPVKVLYTPHAFSYLSATSNKKRMLFITIERIFKHFNSILLACSKSEQDRGIQEVGYKKEKTLYINNAISPIEINTKSSVAIELPKHYICTIGRPSFQKNIEMMVEVVNVIKKHNSKIHLVIMGVGEYSPNKENVERLIEKYNLKENITLIPWMERSHTFSIVKNALLYISTSRYEGLPYSIIEALALKKACVVTDSDGNRDLVKDNYNGFVIKDFSVQKMADSIIELLTNDNLREKFELNSFQFFEENLKIESNIKKLEESYIKYSKS